MFWAWRWGPSEAEPFWTKFLRSLTARGLRGVKLVISDSLEGLKKAVSKVFSATRQRWSHRSTCIRTEFVRAGTEFYPCTHVLDMMFQRDRLLLPGVSPEMTCYFYVLLQTCRIRKRQIID
jgi:Transposase, Mutator family